MAPGDIVDIGMKIASIWSNQLSEYPNSVGVSSDAYSCCMTQERKGQFGSRSVKAVVFAAVLLGLGLATGCIAIETGFDSPAPSKRLDAIVEASALEDDESLIKLVEKLRSTDPAERMFAIRSLEIRTGFTLDYHHAALNWQRVEAYIRWIGYLEEQGIETDDLTADLEDHVEHGEEAKNQPMEHDAD